ncbi:hypothetical protein [Nitrosomonas halophila]|uniref:Uncharacterized protein n=1 Tax=Nitrosomonas halophila TaxID=44576 RepID=A0A1H3NLJ1_9PROT|nr:hypothetical protein [Nitrosomonas halophila]SDY89295.1 hypothetical protein SAMN05421881_107510 [Nitrosomonas halophila]HRQ05280.1 hypothetical protein [Nitrosomonas halophila]
MTPPLALHCIPPDAPNCHTYSFTAPKKLFGNFRFGASRGNGAAIQFNGNLTLMLGALSGSKGSGRWSLEQAVRIGTHHAAA